MVRDLDPAVVLWLTGLSGSGKSTIGNGVYAELMNRGVAAEYLDGDVIRQITPTGFSRPERDAHVIRVGSLASRFENDGVTAICALISPYARSRRYVRAMCRHFIEIYVATPLDECERRDVKGLYALARSGRLRHFTGIDDPYEPPENPELTLDTASMSIEAAVHAVLEVWSKRVRNVAVERS